MKATRGLGAYLLETYPNPSCAVSCDSRIHSRDFAELTAAVLAEMGIAVRIYPELEPTPMLSFAVRHLAASAGVMITASHNPAKYNGYKVYGADGCQITLEAASRIQRHIARQDDLSDHIPSFDQYLSYGMIRYITDETVEAYYRSVWNLRVFPCSQPLHLIYSPLNGAGNVPVREIMRRMGNIRVEVVPEQELPDGNFPTCPYPNPEIREAMNLAIEKTIRTGADLCFATDPDCDRMGAGVRIGNEVTLISGNDMGILMLDYLCRHTERTGSLPPVVVKTIVTTEMASALCRKYGLELRNVLTGFKYIGEQIGLLEAEGMEKRFLFGFEESYGYLSGTDVRDKDAVNAALLLCDMAADLKSQGMTLLDRLRALQQEFGLYVQRLLTYEYEGQYGSLRMQEIMTGLRRSPDLFDNPFLRGAGRVDYLLDDTGLPKSDVISFSLPDDDQFIVRPSGTEPKLKAYLFTRAQTAEEAEQKLHRLQSLVDQLCR
jgi:phosphoglucomutase